MKRRGRLWVIDVELESADGRRAHQRVTAQADSGCPTWTDAIIINGVEYRPVSQRAMRAGRRQRRAK